MRSGIKSGAWRSALLVVAGACVLPAQVTSGAGDAGNRLVQFHGGATHTGLSASPGPEQYGGLAWRFATGGPVRSSPIIVGSRVIIGSSDGHVYALDRVSGGLLWSTRVDGPVAAGFAADRDAVYTTTMRNSIVALSLSDGRPLWSRQTGKNAALAWEGASGDNLFSSPTIVGDVLLAGSGDGGLYALDRATGRIKWKFATGGRVRSSPAVSEGQVYVTSFDGSLYAVDLATGARRWRFDTEGRGINSAEAGYDRRSIQASPVVSRGVIYFGARDGHFYAVRAADGHQLWRIDHDETSWSIATPVVSDSVIWDASSDARFFHALRQSDGKELWRITTPGAVWSSAVVAGKLAYFGDGSGTVHAIDLETHAERWSLLTGGSVYSSPAIGDGMLFVGSADGYVYAVRGAATAGRAPATAAAVDRVVYWDSVLAARARPANAAAAVVVKDFLTRRGYHLLNGPAFASWLTSHEINGHGSVVVLALDQFDNSISGAVGMVGTTMRAYLQHGGKVVSIGDPPYIWSPDSSGGRDYAGISAAATARVIGVPHDAARFDRWGVTPTTEGARWGLRGWWNAAWSIMPSDSVTVLARNETGLAGAWVRSYGGAPGAGFVQMNRTQWGSEDLAQLAAVAEYFPCTSGQWACG
jgi:eukaryotic-like serine/threonine-protein kinase